VSSFTRYLLLQAPGWLAVTAALAALRWLADVPWWTVPVGLALFVAKDLAMYPVMRDTLRPPRRALVGSRGRAVDRLAPSGYVRVDGELWRAETAGDAIPAGAEIIVRELRGLTAQVEPAGPG
jgi:membrane protein implicated in regulation of membrane protease activity